jgi:hypothetical protein
MGIVYYSNTRGFSIGLSQHYRTTDGGQTSEMLTLMKLRLSMGNSSYRVNFDVGKKNKIHHHS